VETLLEFASKVYSHKDRLSALVKQWKQEGASIAGYGAARSGPTLIAQLGLTGAIDFILDDHSQKVLKYTSGEGIQIVPTSELYLRMPSYTVILAWVHSEKIIEVNKEYLNKGGRFVVLCPEPRIVSLAGMTKI
jgi:hypothetical protein